MSYVDQLYQLRVDFDKQAKARRRAVEQQFQAIRDAQEKRAEEAEREFAETDEGKARALWDAASDPMRWGYYEED